MTQIPSVPLTTTTELLMSPDLAAALQSIPHDVLLGHLLNAAKLLQMANERAGEDY